MKRAAVAIALLGAAAAGFVAGRRSSWLTVVGTPAPRAIEAPAGGLATPPVLALADLADAPVRNLVLAVGDGLGVAQLAAARLRAFGPAGRFALEQLPVSGFVATHPEGRLVAKSDSSATALASGVRTPVGRLGLDDAGAPLPTLLEAAAAAGMVTGLVTTSQVFDATPAAFYAHVARRSDYGSIVEQLAAAPVDLVAGGGRERFTAAQLAAARARGVDVALDVESLARAEHLPLWALFPGQRLGEEPAHPTLAQLAARALDLLPAEATRRGGGFFLLLEEEGIDTAGHDNDFERLTQATLRFDAAVALAVKFAAADGRTLVVVVGDHATGGLVIDAERAAGAVRVVWTTPDHSGEPVPLFAYGPPSAQRAFSGSLDLPEVGRRLRAALRLGAR